MGRRERKKQATRDALSAAALRLSLEHGVEHVTVEQIADTADVARRTFFNHFASKEEAVVAGDAARGEVLVERFRARPAAESVLTALHAAVLAHVDDLVADSDREAIRLLRRSPSLLPHQLAAYAAGERALALAVARRIGEVPDDDSGRLDDPDEPDAGAPGGDVAGTEAARADDVHDEAGGDDATPVVGVYPALVAATAMAGLRVAVQQWTDVTADAPRDVTALHDLVGEVFDRLSGGLDRR